MANHFNNSDTQASSPRPEKPKQAVKPMRPKRTSAMSGKRAASRKQPAKPTKKQLIAIIVAALVVVVVGVVLVVRAINSTSTAQTAQPERLQVDAKQTVEFNSMNYYFEKDSKGVYQLIAKPQNSNDGEPEAVLKANGTPVSIVLFDGSIIFGENQSDGSWDVMSYTPGDGAVASELLGKDEKPVKGTGQLESMNLDGTNLKLSIKDSQPMVISLV